MAVFFHVQNQDNTNMVTCLRRFTGLVYRLYSVTPGDELHASYYELLQVHSGKIPGMDRIAGLDQPRADNSQACAAIPGRTDKPRYRTPPGTITRRQYEAS